MFRNCTNLTSVTIPTSISYIGDYAFEECYSLTSIELPTSLETVAYEAFYKVNLNSLIIPNNVKSIKYQAFARLGNLTDLYACWNASELNELTLGNIVFKSTPVTTAKLHVPVGTTSAYQSKDQLNAFTNIVDDLYRITYNLDGGVSYANRGGYTSDMASFTLNNPTKKGYDFDGWTGSNGDTPQTTVTIANGSTGDKSYTANWTPTEYTISYELNDGVLTAPNPTSYTIESDDITLNNPTKEGYLFVGWTGSNGTIPQTTVTIAKGSTGDCHYEATWIANKLTDGTAYPYTSDVNITSATYTKTIDNERKGKFQAWLVPFDYTLTEDDLKTFTFYKINMIANSSSPTVAASEEMWVFLKNLKADDVLHANMPYVYKPLEAVTNYEFTTSPATMKAPNTGVILKTETAEDIYSFYATYNNTTATPEDPFYYVNIDGDVCLGNNGTLTVGPYRWIIRKTSKFGNTSNYTRKMHFIDEKENTGIQTIDTLKSNDTAVYTLDGRRIEKPTKSGIYIIGGRKIVIK